MLRSPTRLRHNIANRVLNLLSEMINRRYPQATDVTETDLLDWKMWPSYLGIIGKYFTVICNHANCALPCSKTKGRSSC